MQPQRAFKQPCKVRHHRGDVRICAPFVADPFHHLQAQRVRCAVVDLRLIDRVEEALPIAGDGVDDAWWLSLKPLQVQESGRLH